MLRSLSRAPRRARALFLASSTALLAACGGGSSEPTPVPTPGTLAVVVSPAAVSVVAGASAASGASITRGGSFTGAVTLTAEGAPAGVTVSFGTASLGAEATTSTIAIATTSSAAAGTYPITIKAAGTGVSVASATLTLTVTPAPSGTLGVAVAPTSLNLIAGNGGSATATVTRGGGFAGDVALTASGAPSGMTVTLTPATVGAAATTSTIAVTTTASLTAGTYPIIVSAAGTGVTTATTTLSVVVTAPVSGNAVSLSYCTADAPIWVAYQDGTSGAWTRVTPNAGTNTYQFTATNTKIGIATVDTVGTGYNLNVTYATTAEANGFGGAQGLGRCGSKTVNGTIANVPGSQLAFVTLGYSTAFTSLAQGGTFNLTNVALGPQDLFAARVSAATFRADKLILRRNQNIANGGSLAVLDFNAAEAFAPASATVTLNGLGADTAAISSLYNGTRGSAFGFIQTLPEYLATSGAVGYDGIPAAKLNSGEVQALFAAATAGSSSRVTGVYFTAPVNQTLTLGPALSTPTLTRLAGGAYSRVQAQLPVQSSYNKSFTASFSQTAANRQATITVTSGYQGSASTWDVTIPSFSGSGWLDTWGLLNGTPISWDVSANGGVYFLLDTSAAAGSTFSSASKSSTTPLP